MKINGKNAVIATMAIAMAAGIAGSISGTVAWFQYNTRVTSEFTGTTAKCTEFLQVRTAKKTIAIKGYGDALPTTATSGWDEGDKFVKSDDKKIYTCTAVDGDGHPSFDGGKAVVNNAVYKDSTTLHVYDGSDWSTPAESTLYGDWGTSVDNTAILTAAGRADGGLSPVTAPGATASGALPTLYGAPICGYEKYRSGTYHWQTADAADYMQFNLQFRVLDVDGEEGDPNALISTNLYLTDLTIEKKTAGETEDISSAVRVHLASSTANAHLGKGSEAATITTKTTGSLDLNLDGRVDDNRDVPGGNYTFNTDSVTPLAYGSDDDMGTSVAYSNAFASNGLYPTNDGVGHLSGGTALGVTNGAAVPATDAAYFTLGVTIYLEGWQPLDVANANAATTNPAATIWDSASYIGSEFNIGMSFGVTAL